MAETTEQRMFEVRRNDGTSHGDAPLILMCSGASVIASAVLRARQTRGATSPSPRQVAVAFSRIVRSLADYDDAIVGHPSSVHTQIADSILANLLSRQLSVDAGLLAKGGRSWGVWIGVDKPHPDVLAAVLTCLAPVIRNHSVTIDTGRPFIQRLTVSEGVFTGVAVHRPEEIRFQVSAIRVSWWAGETRELQWLQVIRQGSGDRVSVALYRGTAEQSTCLGQIPSLDGGALLALASEAGLGFSEADVGTVESLRLAAPAQGHSHHVQILRSNGITYGGSTSWIGQDASHRLVTLIQTLVNMMPRTPSTHRPPGAVL